MRSGTFVLAAALVVASAGVSRAQPDRVLTPIEIAAACAPPPTLGPTPEGVPRVIGSQDTVARRLFGPRDLLVIDAGTKAGLDLGREYFVRRPSRFGMGRDGRARGAVTVGWVRIVAVNESTAIAFVDQACGGIIAGDYLQTFVAPVVPANADRDERVGEADFKALARVIAGNDDRLSAGIGDFIMIDRGSEQGLVPGARFSVYRDIGVSGMPLASVGEGIVIATGDTVSMTRLTSARDAVVSGDYVAIRK